MPTRCIEGREVSINYQSDRINKQISSLPDILIKLKTEINTNYDNKRKDIQEVLVD